MFHQTLFVVGRAVIWQVFIQAMLELRKIYIKRVPSGSDDLNRSAGRAEACRYLERVEGWLCAYQASDIFIPLLFLAKPIEYLFAILTVSVGTKILDMEIEPWKDLVPPPWFSSRTIHPVPKCLHPRGVLRAPERNLNFLLHCCPRFQLLSWWYS